MQTIIDYLSELSDKELEVIIADINTCEKQGLISENVRKMAELQAYETGLGRFSEYQILVTLFVYKEVANRWVASNIQLESEILDASETALSTLIKTQDDYYAITKKIDRDIDVLLDIDTKLNKKKIEILERHGKLLDKQNDIFMYKL